MKTKDSLELTRRQALQALAVTLPFGSVFARSIQNSATAALEEKLPPVRPLTRGPRFHWHAYYDKLLFDPTDRYVLCQQVDFEGRSPGPDNVIRVGMVDTQDGDRWIELGQSRAWNWQQGCMLQWRPGHENEVVWNDREGGQFVCHILDIKTGKKRTLPHPIYCLSPDGRWALAPDFRRLNDTRPGYGYTGIADPNRNVAAPDDAGIWRLDLNTGEHSLIFTIADAITIPFTGEPGLAFEADAKHWFNHLLVNTDGSRFFFLHRWRPAAKTVQFYTRAFTAAPDGKDLYQLIPSGKVSHFVWRDADHITAYAGHPPTNEWKFCVFEDKSRNVEVIGEGVLAGDGHISYVPGTANRWVINDTYPDAQRCQNPHLFHIPTRRRVSLGCFHSAKEYTGEWRCDLHPCCSRDGQRVIFDSPHDGGRQVYMMDISGIIG